MLALEAKVLGSNPSATLGQKILSSTISLNNLSNTNRPIVGPRVFPLLKGVLVYDYNYHNKVESMALVFFRFEGCVCLCRQSNLNHI